MGQTNQPHATPPTGAAADVHGLIAARLARQELRYTAGRRTLVSILSTATRPLTLPEILGHDTGLVQSSAYRNLAELVDLGLVHRVVGSDDHGRFELAEEITGHHHHHLICTTCGQVLDLPMPDGLERAITAAITTVGERTGFVSEDHRLDLMGTCASCATALSSAS